ncbi:MAG TPA: hypothetical protein VMZ29_09990 [Candidatus Bathyarchaeia archaeon]|nr:hypothetical protein [Candidatus Bathyarchaeia archaeon]
MAKIEDEIKAIKSSVADLEGKIDKLQFFLIQIMNKIGEGVSASGESAQVVSTPGAINIDITPLEERLDQLAKSIISKADLEPINQALANLHDARIKEAEDTIDNVTVLLEKGLALTELTSTLKEIESHLQELVTPPKK